MRLQLFAATGFLAAIFVSGQALAMQIASAIDYAMSSETLSGYSKTWKDPWDGDYCYCLWPNPDDTCAGMVVEHWVVFAYSEVYNPSSQQIDYLSTADGPKDNVAQASWSRPSSMVPSPLTANAFNIGVWTVQGTHYERVDVYAYFCYPGIPCGGGYQGSGPLIGVGTTTAQTTVCVPNQSVLDSAAIAVAVGWPTEPWERGVSIHCRGSAPLTYDYFTDSFGTIYGYPTHDPCGSTTVTYTEMAGHLHSHPYFNTNAEYNAENGCHGEPRTMTPQELSDYNASNEGFSEVDAAVSAGKASYLKTPTQRVLRTDAATPAYSPVQVYP